jgi:predicted metal-dependent hydrolase
MEESKSLDIEGISILFRRSSRAKRISISVAPFWGVRVAVPYSSSFLKAEQFARSRIGWVKKHLQQFGSCEPASASNGNIVGFDNIDRAAARKLLVKRLRVLAKQHGFVCNRITIRNQKTRWGSCSCKNDISLNMKLVRLPEDLMDYVILHELVHTRIKDHSPLFWAEMDKLVGDGRQMRRRLKSYSNALCM